MTPRPCREPPDPLSEADRRLQRHLAEGDATAFRQWLDQHLDQAYALALRVLGNAAEAEAVAQAALLELWSGRDTQQAGPARILLYRAVVRHCRDAARHCRPEPGAGRPPVAGGTHPADTADRLEQALGGLPEPQRLALILSYTDALDQAEIAAILGLDSAAVATLLAQGRRQLRQLLRMAAGQGPASSGN